MNKGNDINKAKIKIDSIEWYVPPYISSLEQQKTLSNQLANKIPTELQYVRRSPFMKQATTRIFGTLELGTEEGMDIPIWIIVGFQKRDRQDSQNMNNDMFRRTPVTSSQTLSGAEDILITVCI